MLLSVSVSAQQGCALVDCGQFLLFVCCCCCLSVSVAVESAGVLSCFCTQGTRIRRTRAVSRVARFVFTSHHIHLLFLPCSLFSLFFLLLILFCSGLTSLCLTLCDVGHRAKDKELRNEAIVVRCGDCDEEEENQNVKKKMM